MELNATIFIQAAIFFVLLAILAPVLFDPFLKLFDERERRMVGAAEEAKRLSGSADKSAQELQQKTQAAQAEARQILATLRETAAAHEQRIIAQARGTAATRLDEARDELFEATEAARQALKDEAKTLSNQIVERVLGRTA